MRAEDPDFRPSTTRRAACSTTRRTRFVLGAPRGAAQGRRGRALDRVLTVDRVRTGGASARSPAPRAGAGTPQQGSASRPRSRQPMRLWTDATPDLSPRCRSVVRCRGCRCLHPSLLARWPLRSAACSPPRRLVSSAVTSPTTCSGCATARHLLTLRRGVYALARRCTTARIRSREHADAGGSTGPRADGTGGPQPRVSRGTELGLAAARPGPRPSLHVTRPGRCELATRGGGSSTTSPSCPSSHVVRRPRRDRSHHRWRARRSTSRRETRAASSAQWPRSTPRCGWE